MTNLRRVLLVLVAGISLMGVEGTTRVALPIVSGIWYPSDPKELKAAVEKCVADSKAPVPPGKCVGIIAPHGPYKTSGTIAGAAFKQIERGRYNRVIVLAPAHHARFRGCSIPSVQFYQTPLGAIPLDGVAIRTLSRSTLVEVRSVQYGQSLTRQPLHENEYTVEAMLPFLQVRLGQFVLIPMLVGQFEDYNGKIDLDGIDAVAHMLEQFVDDRTLVVVSSDFTHYGNRFGYRPFKDNIVQNIEALDKAAFDLILKKDPLGFKRYLDETEDNICGKEAILLFLKLLPKKAEGEMLAYDLTARMSGKTESSISFAAFTFNDPVRPTLNKKGLGSERKPQ